MLNLITETCEERQGFALSLDEIAREGAKKMLIQALHAEVAEYIVRHSGTQDDHGRALVVRNGKAQPRRVTMGSGTVEVAAPRVNDRRPGVKFTSSILPPYLRRSPKVENLLPILYLKGLSSSDFQSALEDILGPNTSGLSASYIVSLKKCWEKDFDNWKKRSAPWEGRKSNRCKSCQQRSSKPCCSKHCLTNLGDGSRKHIERTSWAGKRKREVIEPRQF